MTSLDTSKRNQSRWMTAAFWEPNKGAGWYPVLTMPRNPRLDPCIPYAAYWDGKYPTRFLEGKGQPQNKEVVFFLNERFDKATDAVTLANSEENDMLPQEFVDEMGRRAS